DRRQKQQSQVLEQDIRLLHTETNRHARTGALRTVVFYCQEKSIAAACLELQYQLLWGGQHAADVLASDVTIKAFGWVGKIPAVAWRVASETASAEEDKRKLHHIWLGYGGKP